MAKLYTERDYDKYVSISLKCVHVLLKAHFLIAITVLHIYVCKVLFS